MEDSQNPLSANDGGHSAQPQSVPASNLNFQAGGYLQNLPAYVPPTSGPVSLPPETYNYLVQHLTSLQASANLSCPLPYNNHPHDRVAFSEPWTPYQYQNNLIPSPNQTSGSSTPPPPSPGPSRAGGTGSEPDVHGDGDRDGEEDKRHRNNSASARSRLKKKQETLRLERTVSDLAGRFEELEREATELRKENNWLKELVLLRGKSVTEVGSSEHDEHVPSEDDDLGNAQERGGGSITEGKGKGKSLS